VHFDKEEAAYLPLLDMLPAEEADALGRRLGSLPGHEHAE
jgi:hypothetical protein